MRLWFTYAEGLHRGIEIGKGDITMLREDYERVLAILREELADVIARESHQAQRADAACDLLLTHLGARAISRLGQDAEGKRLHTMSKLAGQFALDPTDDHPLGTPGTEFGNGHEDASILVREPAE